KCTLLMEQSDGKFEMLCDEHDLAHSVQQFEVAMIEVAVEADGTKHRVRLTGRAVDVEAVGNQAVDDVLDLGFAGPFLHHNDHKVFLLPSPLAFHPSRGSGGPTPPCRQKPTAS